VGGLFAKEVRVSLRRIWIDAADIAEPIFELSEEAFHHAVVVSRFREGEEFEIVSGQGEALKARLIDVMKKSARVQIIGRRKLPELKKPYINLAISIPKWSTLEFVVEKAVELGVHSIQPLISDFSFIRSASEMNESRVHRMQKILRSATEQSGRGDLMKLNTPKSLRDFAQALMQLKINQKSRLVGLFAYEGVSSLDIRTEMDRFKAEEPEEIWAFIGSEGGFSAAEVEFMSNLGLPPVTIGEQILRVDTACIAIASVIKYGFGQMR
jgi:16S rRNA (uracil1498-N3)-methyltransferase